MIVAPGTTDISIDVRVYDDDGLPVTGLAAATFPVVKYSRGTGNDATVSLSDLSALTDAHSDGGLKERGEGVYRLDLPDAVASSAGVTTIRGEATDKRLIAETIEARNVASNVTQFGGTNGTFSGGRPEVNTTHVGGSAIQQSGGYVRARDANDAALATAATQAAVVAAITRGRPVRFVSTTLTGSNVYSTLALAIAACSGNELIVVDSGTWTGNVSLASLANIHIVGYGATIAGGASGSGVIVAGNNTTLEGLTITTSSSSLSRPAIAGDAKTGLKFINVTARNIHDSAGVAVYLLNCGDVLYDGCYFEGQQYGLLAEGDADPYNPEDYKHTMLRTTCKLTGGSSSPFAAAWFSHVQGYIGPGCKFDARDDNGGTGLMSGLYMAGASRFVVEGANSYVQRTTLAAQYASAYTVDECDCEIVNSVGWSSGDGAIDLRLVEHGNVTLKGVLIDPDKIHSTTNVEDHDGYITFLDAPCGKGGRVQAATSTTIKMQDGHLAAVGDRVRIIGGTGRGQTRVITSDDDRVQSIDVAWDTTPDTNSIYQWITDRSARINANLQVTADPSGVRTAVGLASANLDTQLSTIDTVADAVKAKTDQLTFTTANKVDATADVTLSEQNIDDIAEAVADLVDAGSGGGARTVTITVNDGANTLQNATVRMTEGPNTYTAITNASGVATFNLDDATYVVGISKSGYSFAGTSLVVNGNETATYSMTQVVISPPQDPDQATGYLTSRDAQGDAQGNVTFTFELQRGPGDDGYSYDGATFTATSNGSGLLEVALVRGAIYQVRRGSGRWFELQVPDEDTFALPEVLEREG